MRATRGLLKGLNPVMALTALSTVFVFVVFGVTLPGQAEALFGQLSSAIVAYFKWYYVAVVAFFLLFSIGLLLSRFGSLRLGDDDQKPEFSYFSWFSMLFGAGMGIGLVFWSIGEPILHFQDNPFVTEGETREAAVTAMRLTYFHWGMHPWAIYAVVGLSLSFFSYRKKLPLSIRSALYPIIGERIYGPIGHTVDVLAVFGTLFGISTSLGLGVQQMNTGLNELFGVQISVGNQILLIGSISVVATLSVVSGVGRGVRILSVFNLYMSFVVLAFFLIWGPTVYLLENYIQGIGDYLQHLVSLSFWTDAHTVQEPGWQADWTAFYWAWWIAWAPFVGMFIARISRGRTIREFVLGVLFVPTLLAMLWLTVFGGTGLWLELFGPGGLVEAVNEDVTRALYFTVSTIGHPPWVSTIMAAVVTLLIASYFITSSDSGTLVITTLLSLGDDEPPIRHRVVWGLGEGLVASVLLLAGGLAALQAAAIIAALPFSLIMLFMCFSLIKGLRDEQLMMHGAGTRNNPPL